MFNIAPKRPNWDLKREMEKKLAKLERRTQEAVHILIRQFYHSVLRMIFLTGLISGQRLAAQKGDSDDLVGAMAAQERQNATEVLSDEEEN